MKHNSIKMCRSLRSTGASGVGMSRRSALANTEHMLLLLRLRRPPEAATWSPAHRCKYLHAPRSFGFGGEVVGADSAAGSMAASCAATAGDASVKGPSFSVLASSGLTACTS